MQTLLKSVEVRLIARKPAKTPERLSTLSQTLTTLGLALDGSLSWDPDLLLQTRAELGRLEQILRTEPLPPSDEQDLAEIAESVKATADVFNQTLGDAKPLFSVTLFSASAHRATLRLTVELVAVGTANIPVGGCRIQAVHKSGWSHTSTSLTPKVHMEIVPVSQSLFAIDRHGVVVSDRFDIKIGQALATDATVVLRADRRTACST